MSRQKLSDVKQTILNILSDSKSSVSEIGSYAPHIKNNEKIFAIFRDNTNRFADFSVQYITDKIICYEIRFDYNKKISRIAFPKARFHRPGVRDMLEIHTAVSLKTLSR